jgi:hypothetical protein
MHSVNSFTFPTHLIISYPFLQKDWKSYHISSKLILSQLPKSRVVKVRPLLEYSCSWFKIMVIFNIKSVDFIFISADVILKMAIILNQLRIAQLCSKNRLTLVIKIFLKITHQWETENTSYKNLKWNIVSILHLLIFHAVWEVSVKSHLAIN